MYRSFVTCDDPNGVVECGSIRRYKKMEPKIEKGKAKSKSLHRPSSLQLMEVSDGAQKLNQVINSWSKGEKHEKDSKDLAKDLLKGALELQESLAMLGKLQEASKQISKLKEKRKSDVSRVDSSSFRFQNPCFSTDGDSTEELKKVIRESLARHNLLPKRNIQENDSFSGRHFDSASDLPSTSSSQSSMIRTSNFSSTDSLISSATSQKKTKGPTLIAKLMGVEEFPSKMPVSANQQRPVFDIDMPKPQILPKRITLQEILETTYCQGISEGNRIKEIDSCSHHFHDSFPQQKPPIVVIKPVRIPWSKCEIEKPSTPVFGEEMREVEVSLNSYRTSNKIAEGETTRRRRISHDEVKTTDNFSSKLKSSGPRIQQHGKKGESEKKLTKVVQKKLGPNGAKPEEKKMVKAKTKVTPIKTHDSRKQGGALESIYTSKSRAILHDTNDRKRSSMVKKEKPNSKPTPAKKITENLRSKGDDKRINLNSENEQKESSQNQIGGFCNNGQSPTEIIPLVAESQEDAKSSEEVDDRISPCETTAKSTLKALLLSNPAFLNHAKELLDLNLNVLTTPEVYSTVDATDAEAELFLDCANEIVERRSKPFRFMRINVSVDQLLDEVCHGVGTLRSYSELAGKTNLTDSLQTTLERDIWHKENTPSGIWDLGWRNEFSGEEMENIVYDLETQILTALVEEVCS